MINVVFAVNQADLEKFTQLLSENGVDPNSIHRITLSLGPDGYALHSFGQNIVEAMNSNLGGEARKVKDFDDMSPEQQEEVLGLAASSVRWIRDYKFDDVYFMENMSDGCFVSH